MGPSIEGLGCTVTLFQLILKYFKRRHHFVDPGVFLRASMPAMLAGRWEQEFDRSHFLTLRDLIWSNHASFRDSTRCQFSLYLLSNFRAEEKESWLVNENVYEFSSVSMNLHLARTVKSWLNNCLSTYELIVQGSLLSCAALRLQSWLEVSIVTSPWLVFGEANYQHDWRGFRQKYFYINW